MVYALPNEWEKMYKRCTKAAIFACVQSTSFKILSDRSVYNYARLCGYDLEFTTCFVLFLHSATLRSYCTSIEVL
uniref:Uncharacterized protein n=1 Tax=Anopheles christyi TaxID=43041 RepID=A0A182KI65_9DIPT